MNELLASALVSQFFPSFRIDKIEKIGEGTGNVAFEVNSDFIFRFPKKPENQKQLEQEISIQKQLTIYSTLPFPMFIFIPPDHSFAGYKKIQGASLLTKQNEYVDWETISKQLGCFLNKLHSIESEKLSDLDILAEERSVEDWLSRAQDYFEKTKHLIDDRYLQNIEAFFNTKPPEYTQTSVFCHNDLGIEHIFVINDKISGIID
ncbi:MAG: aminoglycoside phosphotransferase family protein [Candidatus Levybacteria bacterium]|nr:aminoglycoside phosphotransferase family protein [Candidatus Levybacteria bacterium]